MQNRLREVRNKTNLTLSSYSRMIGIPSDTLRKYEVGEREPRLKTWEKLANFWEVSVPYLQGLDQIWYQAECLECHKVFRISSQDADKVKCCPFCKKFYLAISKAS
ncbi:MAG: helix-turn-helix transcriptional regulator [Lactobacillus paragasseri]|nr:helix-turn-helix transcriptional regulator [Lactobacillus paragasseri]